MGLTLVYVEPQIKVSGSFIATHSHPNKLDAHNGLYPRDLGTTMRLGRV